MSTLATKVEAKKRHRKAVARELGKIMAAQPHAVRADSTRTGGFDVHAAREHARSLIAISDEDRKSTAISELDMYSGRLGQRILDALEGQPSECQAVPWTNHGRGAYSSPLGVHLQVGDGEEPILCPDCHGTGHNLRGKLPEVEWSPAVRRRVSDHHEGTALESNLHHHQWLDDMGLNIFQRLRHPGPDGAGYYTTDTRVCPRGEHRNDVGVGARAVGINTPDQRIVARAWHPWSSPMLWKCDGKRTVRNLMPTWRRGEIEQARQRGNAA